MNAAMVAQRRPEPELRRHARTWPCCGQPGRALNEGRSRNSGDTPQLPSRTRLRKLRSTKAGAGTPATPQDGQRYCSRACCAQRRPEPELRRHPRAGARRRACASSLNEGRSRNSGDTTPSWYVRVRCERAQRRPEPELRRHRGVAVPYRPRSIPAQRRPEPELRRHMLQAFAIPGCSTAQRRPEPELRRHPPVGLAGVVVPRIAQRRPEPELRRHLEVEAECERRSLRSTKAGAGTPATPLIVMIDVEPVKLRCIRASNHRLGGRIAKLWCTSQEKGG